MDWSYFPVLVVLAGVALMGLLFYLVMKQLGSRDTALTEMATKIEAANSRLDSLGTTVPFFKHVENTFSDILHHDNEEDARVDRLLEQLKRAPEEPMSPDARNELKGLFVERGEDARRSDKERKVARLMGEIMDLALDEEADTSPLTDTKMVGSKYEQSAKVE